MGQKIVCVAPSALGVPVSSPVQPSLWDVVASGTIQLVAGVDPAVREEIADQLAAASAFYTVTFRAEGHVLRAGLVARRGNGHFLLRAAAVFTFGA